MPIIKNSEKQLGPNISEVTLWSQFQTDIGNLLLIVCVHETIHYIYDISFTQI